MRKILLFIIVISVILSFSACGEGENPPSANDNNNDIIHEHAYGDAWSFSTQKHYYMCDCGSKINSADHTDVVFDGACDVCGYKMYELFTVSVTKDAIIDTEKTKFVVKSEDDVVFTATVSEEYGIIALGAVISGQPKVADGYKTYTLVIASVTADTEVVLTANKIEKICEHKWNDATCISPRTCKICGEERGFTAPHSGGEATCTKAAVCEVCTRPYGKPLGHTLVAASCTDPGRCEVCGFESSEPIGHLWIDASCTLPEYCSRCFAMGAPATGHNYSDPTCNEPGICLGCGSTRGNAMGHKWSDASCESPKNCENCGITEGAPLGHNWQDATCTLAEYCLRCLTTRSPAKGHLWTDATCTDSAACTTCGETKGNPIGHTWEDADCTTPRTCSYCGITDGKALGHDYKKEIIYPTCVEEGYTKHVCHCGAFYSTNRVNATGHVGGTPTFSEPGLCAVCGEAYIPALGYPITSITVSGESIAEYDIVCDKSNATLLACARSLRNILYENAGISMSIVDSSATPAVIIRLVDYAGVDGFRMYTDSYNLIIESAYEMFMVDAMNKLIEDNFASTEKRSIEFTKDTLYSVEVNAVRYSEFGAVGDGVTDDFAAIKAAHERANATGMRVVADSGKTYNLGQHADRIVIKTDVVWTGATFIIDDSNILPGNSVRNYHVFVLASDRDSYSVSGIGALSAGQTNVGMTFETDVLLRLCDSTIKQYIRYGLNGDDGADQQEIILVDKNGNVDPSTPILWNYSSAMTVTAYPCEDKPITIVGGHFITIANVAPRAYTYYNRGIQINRSNVTMIGQLHTIEGEGDNGAPYNGFVSISFANNVLFDSITFTGHKTYKLATDANNSMGTYDISVNSANNIKWLNCTQTNSITDTAYWGVMGSNYCKNLTYDGCVLSRFDAHKGTHNATIINSEIGHQRINAIGSGVLLVENTTVHANQLINLRNDYGSTWDGDVIIRNITMKNTSTVTLIYAVWTNHYFGYTCHLPKNITVDGVTLTVGATFYILPNLSSTVDDAVINGAPNKNPYVLPEKVYMVSKPQGYYWAISVNTELFKDVEIISK